MKSMKTMAFLLCALMAGMACVAPALAEIYAGDALTYPQDVRDFVPLLEQPSADATVVEYLPGGVLVMLDGGTEPKDGFYKVVALLLNAEAGLEGYIPADQLQKTGELQQLFTIDRVTPAPGGENIIAYNTEYIWPQTEPMPFALEDTPYWLAWDQKQQSGQTICVCPPETEGFYGALAGECTAYAKQIPEGKRFGLVVNEDMTRRQPLWATPEAQGQGEAPLGEYYSGAQVEILGETGGMYQVRLGTLEGYLAQDGIREVTQWKD